MNSARRSPVALAGKYAILVTLSIIWGLAFVAIKVADSQLSPVNLALLRWLIASCGFLVLAPLVGKPKVAFERRDIPRLLVMAFANVVGYHVSLNYAETTVSAGLAGLLISFGPVFIVALSVVVLKEKAGRRLVAALCLALLGAVVLSVGDLGSSTSIVGPLEVVLTAAFYAVFTILAKPMVHKYGAPPTTIFVGLAGTAMLLPFAGGSFVSQVRSMNSTGWSAVLYLGLLSTVIGYMMFYTLVSRGAVSRLSIQLYLAPIVSVVGGALLLGETVTAFTLAGGALLLAGVALATGASK
ncbi:MAG TPA: DMT family transporter [Nitrososphaerales archaeon]|nr:DMT family transporter [Nitrososphaerales archaeon]